MIISTTIETLANAPLQPVLNEVDLSSMSVSVLPGANNPYYTAYALQISSAGGWTNYLSTSGVYGASAQYFSTATWTAATWVLNLLPNTTYTFSAVGQNTLGVATSYSAAFSTPTLAAIPTASGFNVYITSVTPNWLANGNPSGTVYIATETYTTHGSSTTLLAQWLHSGLTPNTTYTYQVQAVNYAQRATGWAVLGTTVTLAQALLCLQ